jgi:broad specificity phosphatase PhoE
MTVAPAFPEPTALVIRHGRTESNVRMAVHCHADIPLDAVGRGQARELATRLGQLAAGSQPAAIVSSPLGRAMETARILGSDFGCTPVSDPDLIEIDLGEIDGFTAEELLHRPDVLARLAGDDLDAFAWPGGESMCAFHRRVARALDRITAEHSGLVMIVTHGGVTASLLGQVRGDSPHAWLLSQCGRFTEAIDQHRGQIRQWPERIANCSVSAFRRSRAGDFPGQWTLSFGNVMPEDLEAHWSTSWHD